MLEFRVLGPLEVRRDGRSVDVRGSKRRAVLALLVLQANEIVRTDRLIEDLWGERRPANAPAALHNHVSRLRKDLGQDVLVTKPWGYVLRAPAEAIDIRRFESLVAEARPLPARERNEKLGAALTLWRGPALADLANEPALAAEIGRLDELRESIVEQQIDARLELGEHAEVVRELERLIGEYPLRERLRGQLILALYRSGRQAEALETYRETRRVLVEELGIEPSPELRELERAILRQDPLLASARVPSEPEPPRQKPPQSRWRWPRSPLVVGAALLVVLAGVAAAILATPRSGTPHASAARPPSSSVESQASGPTANAQPEVPTSAKHREETSPGQKPRPSPHKQQGRPTAPHQTTTAAKPANQTTTAEPPPLPPPPAKSKPKPPPAMVYWIADHFSDPTVDGMMWSQSTVGTGEAAIERNERLEFSVAADAIPDSQNGLYQHYATNCMLTSDFDATVNYELLTWPAANGLALNLGAAHWSTALWLAVARTGGLADGTPEIYATNIGGGAWPRTQDTMGRLRLTRRDGVVSGYYHYRRTWLKLGSERSRLPVSVVISLNTSGNPTGWGGQAAAVAFDNFEVTADSVDCRGVPLPPRKRRR